jgi:hypothetical protein
MCLRAANSSGVFRVLGGSTDVINLTSTYQVGGTGPQQIGTWHGDDIGSVELHRVGEVLIEVENLDIVGERSAGRGRQIERAVDPHDVDAGAAIELPVAKIVQDEDVVARTADNLFKTNARRPVLLST